MAFGTRLVAALWLFCCALLCGCSAAPTANAVPEVTSITDARFVLSDSALPPPAGSAWASVRLPDNWSSSRRGVQGIGWYRMELPRMELPLQATAQPHVAVLIRRLSMNGELFVNGVRVLSGGRMGPVATRNWNVPFFVEIPATLLHADGANVLHVRVFAYRNSNGGLGTVFVGDAATLQRQHLALQALHVNGAVLSFAVALVAAFIGVVAWWRMGRDAMYGLFGLAMMAWAVRYANYFVQETPIDPLLFAVAVYSAQGWFFVFFTPFFLRLAQLHWPLAERALLAMGVAGTLGIYAAFQGMAPLWLVVLLWSFVWVPGSLALLALSARHAWKSRSVVAWLAAAIVWLYVPLTIRELLITADFMPFDGSYIAHYVGVPLALLISWMLIDRVVTAARDTAMAELARARATFDERQRITQDMHDGLGLQLNAALRVIERGQSGHAKHAELLRACLDELRLIVDSSDADNGHLLLLLASLRARLQPRLNAIGIQVRWLMDAFPQQLQLSPQASLQILRIVQEAINNTIKHAQAGSIEFEAATGSRPGAVALHVRDDGIGFALPAGGAGIATGTGKGLSGMQRRAAAAGVALAVTSTAAGTCIRLDIPAADDTLKESR